MNELVEHKSWVTRNWKWFTPLLGILLFLVIAIASSPIGSRISDITKAYGDPYLVKNAVLKAQENEDIVEILGNLEPVNGMDILRGIINYSNNHETIDIYVHINGSKGKGRMRVFADWNTDKWVYNNITIVSENVKEPIVVIENTKE